jgi:hypothetical protein
MISIEGRPRRLCDGMPRRAFLRVGSIAGLGLAWPHLIRADSASSTTESDRDAGRARRCILLFPFGGPSQIDTLDPKPDAPAEIRGEFRPIATAVPGTYITELFPGLARLADRFSLVRSVTHTDSVHTSAGYWMLTGNRHPQANIANSATMIHPTPDDRPHIGALLAHLRPGPADVPPYVNLPEVVKDAGVNEMPGQGAGFLGGRFAPLLLEGDPATGRLPGPEALATGELDPLRMRSRRTLRRQLESRLDRLAAHPRLFELDEQYLRAFDLLGSPRVRDAFDIELESARAREAYGSHLFGQGCLLARRLVEAGVPLVTVFWHYEGPDDSPCWDTHENNFQHLRERLAPHADRAFAQLLRDLEARGLLEQTLVVWMGEFGRSPRVNPKAGREHWPHVHSMILAGGGIARGQVYGASDQIGGYPSSSPVSPGDVGATILHLLGVDPGSVLRDPAGQEVPAIQGRPIAGLLA